MSAPRFELLTVWTVDAPLAAVWPVMLDSLSWPRWWKGLEQVEELERGRPDGIGNVRRYTWRSPLLFRLYIDMCVIAAEPTRLLAARAGGDVEDTGAWRFHDLGDRCRAEYDWRVRVVKNGPMRHLTHHGAPLFAWSHRRLMARGAAGLGRELGCRVHG